MTPESRGTAVEAPAAASGRFTRIPSWARIAVPVVVAGGAVVVATVVAAGSPQPATAESLCRSAAEVRLESRGRSDIDLSRPLQVTEASGAQRVSGTVTFVDDSGAARYAELRCMVRADGDTMRVTSVRFSE